METGGDNRPLLRCILRWQGLRDALRHIEERLAQRIDILHACVLQGFLYLRMEIIARSDEDRILSFLV